ncbi:MAG TPA: hypothetical protein VKI65_09540, partial [Gemmataceae bacterium]|nr:hypothetical protein [Gemmataceae bacterium]
MAESGFSVLPYRHRFPWWIVAGAVVLPCLYLPTLATRFDFIDDGNLVYPEPPMPLAQRLERVWDKIVANYEHLGPFRPVLWAHWEVGAELFGGHSLQWRLARLLWMMLATGMFLWLLRELGIGRWPALATVALAMWNPYRNEIWTSLTLSEGVAMPYALAGLVCAIRAARSRRPTPWDLGGALCVLAALGCKNTFAALVPAQFLLRIAAGDSSLSDGLRRHGPRAALLSLTLLFPVIHYVVFRLTWHPGQYVTGGPSFAQLERMCSVIAGALSLDFLGVGLTIAAIIIVADTWQKRSATGSARAIAGSYRVTLMVGVLLLFAGVAIYLPLDMVSGRYSMPGVWGADIGIALLLSRLGEVATVRWRPLAYAGLACGLIAVAVSNVGRQDKFAARARMLWRA